jgi:threonine dehydrogenase-like Zn-dependent dehydrogenase
MLALRLADRVFLDPECPEPARAPGDALVRMRVAGVCDTDMQLARGYMGFRGILGHEFVGEVLDAGDASWIGRRVVADINAGCGLCDECRLRAGHHCARRSVLGIFGRDGAFAERLTIPERCLVAVPDPVSDEAAVFAEPLAAALHVLDACRGAEGMPAIVLGDGKLGLLTAMALHGAGVRVTLVGHHASKLSIAARLGIPVALEGDLPEATRVPLVVEATGSPGGIARSLSLTCPRGTVVLKTTVADSSSVDLSPIVIDELHVVGSRCGELRQAIEALEAGRVDPRPLIAARYPLRAAEEALAHAARKGTLKILLGGEQEERSKPRS